ncbi:MAG TPA: glycosyltransferase family 4 protein [Acidobacteriota bacterium]|nr:glycosyltransferase family 4 protein [Acidobacteriota bacterium]
MNVLVIGFDSHAADETSETFRRLYSQSSWVDSYTVVVPAAKDCIITKKSFTVIGVSGPKVLYPMLAKNAAEKFVFEKRLNIDVVTSQDPFLAGMAAFSLSRSLECSFHVQMHGDTVWNSSWIYENFYNPFLQLIGSYLIRKADAVRVVSRRVLRRLHEHGVTAAKIQVVPIYTDVSAFKQLSRTEKKPVVVFIGRLSAEKNIPDLLRAWKLFHQLHPKSQLRIIGDGDKRLSLERLTARLGLSSVKFLGRTDPKPHLAVASALVLPSKYEGWGLVAIEAAAAGVGVIMTDVGCAGEIIINNHSGFIVSEHKPKQINERLVTLLCVDGARETLCKNAMMLINELPSLAKTKELYLASWIVACEHGQERVEASRD